MRQSICCIVFCLFASYLQAQDYNNLDNLMVKTNYVVQQGETFNSIAQSNRMSVKLLEYLNPEIAPSELEPGMVLAIVTLQKIPSEIEKNYPKPNNLSGDDDPARKVSVKASFPGGESSFREFVASEFHYPVRCQDKGINGYVVLRFVVDQKGRISRISAIETTASCPEFTDEAIRVLKRSPRWIPAQINGKFVISWREIPIKLTVE